MEKQENFNKEVLNFYVNSTYDFLQKNSTEKEKKANKEKLLKYYKLINSQNLYGNIDNIFIEITNKFLSNISFDLSVTKILDVAEKMYDEYKELFELAEDFQRKEELSNIKLIQHKEKVLLKQKI